MGRYLQLANTHFLEGLLRASGFEANAFGLRQGSRSLAMERAFHRRVAVYAAIGLSAAVTAAAGMHGRRNALSQTHRQQMRPPLPVRLVGIGARWCYKGLKQ